MATDVLDLPTESDLLDEGNAAVEPEHNMEGDTNVRRKAGRKKKAGDVHPGFDSTTTPGGIVAHDPTATGETTESPPQAIESPPQAPTAPDPVAELPTQTIHVTATATTVPARSPAELAYDEEIAGARLNHSQAALRVRAATLNLKSARASEKEYLEELAQLTARGPEYRPLLDQPREISIAGTPTATAPVDTSPPASFASVDTSDAWRHVGIGELGLPPAINEKLAIADVATIGALEDLRASTGGLRSIKGIGQAKADKIEDAVLAWLSAHRDQQVLAKAATTAAAQSSPQSPQATGECTPAEHVARAAELNTGEPSCLDSKHSIQAWRSGYEAFGRVDSDGQRIALGDCMYLAGGERDDWLRGWLSAQVLARYEAEEEEEEEQEVDGDDKFDAV